MLKGYMVKESLGTPARDKPFISARTISFFEIICCVIVSRFQLKIVLNKKVTFNVTLPTLCEGEDGELDDRDKDSDNVLVMKCNVRWTILL